MLLIVEAVLEVGHLLVSVPVGDSAQGTLHAGVIDEVQAVNVGGVHPSKSVISSQQQTPVLRNSDDNLPFSGDTFEIGALVAILGSNAVRVGWVCNIVLLNNDTVEVDECSGHHVDPAMGQSLRLVIELVPL